MPADEFCDQLSLPREIAGEYDTVAGIVLHQLNGLPKLGEIFSVEGYTFEVVDLDGFRIDKVLVTLSIDPGSNDLR
jgi:putative hemolysin